MSTTMIVMSSVVVALLGEAALDPVVRKRVWKWWVARRRLRVLRDVQAWQADERYFETLRAESRREAVALLPAARAEVDARQAEVRIAGQQVTRCLCAPDLTRARALERHADASARLKAALLKVQKLEARVESR